MGTDCKSALSGSTSETGHTKNVTNFKTLLTYCEVYNTNYNPSNTDLLLANLTTFHNESKETLKLVKTTESPFNDVEGQRKILFKPLKSLSTKILGALKVLEYHQPFLKMPKQSTEKYKANAQTTH